MYLREVCLSANKHACRGGLLQAGRATMSLAEARVVFGEGA